MTASGTLPVPLGFLWALTSRAQGGTEMASRVSRRMARRLLVIGGIWALLHVYVGVRLLGHAGLGSAPLALACTGVLLLVVAPFAAFFAGRVEGVPFRAVLEWAGFTAMGTFREPTDENRVHVLMRRNR